MDEVVGRPRKKKKRDGTKIIGRSHEEIKSLKEQILRLIGLGEARTIKEAAEELGILPQLPHSWRKADPEFDKLLSQAKEVVADQLETELMDSGNVIAKIFLLKGLRPDLYRDNYRAEVKDENMKLLLQELVRLGKTPQPLIEAHTTYRELPPSDEGLADTVRRLGE